jgi:hypothetical protein
LKDKFKEGAIDKNKNCDRRVSSQRSSDDEFAQENSRFPSFEGTAGVLVELTQFYQLKILK